ncbi:uncharacterized protein MIR9-1HG isoform X2 [Balaenoptera acutorostrata]|uniref:Uncharacterized protein MIR9-1HG isoform X2 n=1 Tax=Balaenoptera acutorostrata TaxID=9767 RepID=A0ABM3SH78_BALAC|nr:uncharacterized protein MIR9-1HG isoform X2 [Balaenoptera acutorostrata]
MANCVLFLSLRINSTPHPRHTSFNHALKFEGSAARERKREASEIPEWIDRCYVIGAASSTPQEARSREKEAVQRQGPPEQDVLLPAAGSWASEKKQPPLFLVSSKFHDLAYCCLGKSFPVSNQDLYY